MSLGKLLQSLRFHESILRSAKRCWLHDKESAAETIERARLTFIARGAFLFIATGISVLTRQK